MEVKPGYKQTEVGVIPDDWDVQTLEGLADAKRPICYGIVQVGPFTRNGIPVLAIKNLNSDYSTNVHSCLLEIEKLYTRSRVRPGDVLISVKGTTARIGIVPQHFNGNISRDLARLCLTDKDVPAYWFQILQSDICQRKLAVATVGTTRMELSIGILKQIRMPRAPKEEQCAIAEALSDADALIESLEQLIAKKRDIKQGAMQELLTGKKRLPGFGGDWAVKRLEELAEIRSGGTPSTTQPQFWDGDILWCTPTDITALKGHKYLIETSRKITLHGLKGSSAEIIPANSIVMTSRATIGECAINTVPVSTNQGFKNFVPFEAVDVDFLYYLLRTQTQGFISLCGGSTFLEIGKNQLAAFEIKLPAKKAEQTAIAAVLSDMDAEIDTLEEKLAKSRQIKQGMMQELLTGRTRLI